MNKVFHSDLSRYGGVIDRYTKRWLWLFRKTQAEENKLIKQIYHLCLLRIGTKHGIEIDYPVQIGEGLYIGHPFGITINDEVIIGKNCNIHKGVTIGRENRGKRVGAPTIGDNVWIGIGSIIVGKIRIGNDVMIAPNSFVNCDIPDHSIVIGNPCKIIHREFATEGYIQNRVGE